MAQALEIVALDWFVSGASCAPSCIRGDFLEGYGALGSNTPERLDRKRHTYIAPPVESLAVQARRAVVFPMLAEGGRATVTVRTSCRVAVSQMARRVNVQAGKVDEDPLVPHVM